MNVMRRAHSNSFAFCKASMAAIFWWDNTQTEDRVQTRWLCGEVNQKGGSYSNVQQRYNGFTNEWVILVMTQWVWTLTRTKFPLLRITKVPSPMRIQWIFPQLTPLHNQKLLVRIQRVLNPLQYPQQHYSTLLVRISTPLRIQ